VFQLSPPTPLVRSLLIGLGLAYVACVVLEIWVGIPVTAYFGLNVPLGPTVSIGGGLSNSLAAAVAYDDGGGLPAWGVWRIFTHTIVESTAAPALISVLISFFFFAWIMTSFDQRFGPRRTLIMFWLATVASGVAGFAVAMLWGPRSGLALGTGPILYASFVAIAFTIPPDARVLLYGVIPVKNYFGLAIAFGLSVIFFLVTQNAVAFAGDVAAVMTGWGFAKWVTRPVRIAKPRKEQPRRSNGNRPGLRVIRGGRADEAEDDADDDDSGRGPRYLN
jgi:hypothetical protein